MCNITFSLFFFSVCSVSTLFCILVSKKIYTFLNNVKKSFFRHLICETLQVVLLLKEILDGVNNSISPQKQGMEREDCRRLFLSFILYYFYFYTSADIMITASTWAGVTLGLFICSLCLYPHVVSCSISWTIFFKYHLKFSVIPTQNRVCAPHFLRLHPAVPLALLPQLFPAVVRLIQTSMALHAAAVLISLKVGGQSEEEGGCG